MESVNFKNSELKCKCGCGVNGVKQEAVDKLQLLREEIGRPLFLTSAYRCENHPVEVIKEVPGKHNEGIAFDISCTNGALRFEIVQLALELGFTGIGVHKDFIHVDTRQDSVPVVWLY